MIDKRILPLTLGALGIGTAEFTIMGLLPDIARSLQVSIPQAGIFISAYAFGVVVGAPSIIAFTLKQSPKKILMILMALYALFNGLSIIATGYKFMVLTRFLSGLPHGAYFGVGAVVISRFADKGKEARYFSMMLAGLTFANLIAVPLVTYIGHTFHWRWYFTIVTIISSLAFLSVFFMLPAIEPNKNADLRRELQIVKSREFWYLLIITGIGFGGLFSWLSYITPLMTTVTNLAPHDMAYVMALVGGGMVAGNFLGGYLSDRIGAIRTITLLFGAMFISLLLVFFFSSNMAISLILTFICGGLSMAVVSPMNILVIRVSPQAEMFATALMQGAFNFANTAGAYLGSLPLLLGYTYVYPSLIGAFMTLIGVVLCFVYINKYTVRNQILLKDKDLNSK